MTFKWCYWFTLISCFDVIKLIIIIDGLLAVSGLVLKGCAENRGLFDGNFKFKTFRIG